MLASACRGLEKALDHYSHPNASAAVSEASGGDETGRDARRSLMREKRKKALKHLSLPEKDVLTVLSAVCKVCNLFLPFFCAFAFVFFFPLFLHSRLNTLHANINSRD